MAEIDIFGAESLRRNAAAAGGQYGPTPADNTVQGSSFIPDMMGWIGGRAGRTAGQIGMTVLQVMNPDLYRKLNDPVSLGYGGGSADAIRRNTQFDRIATANARTSIGRMVTDMMGMKVSDQTADSVGTGIVGLARAAGMEDQLAALMPDRLFDASPLRTAYQASGGDMSDEKAQAAYVQRFDSAFSSGQFGKNSYKQLAAVAVQAATASYGPTTSMSTAASLYRSSDSFATLGYGTFGQGTDFVSSSFSADEVNSGAATGLLGRVEAYRRYSGVGQADLMGGAEALRARHGGSSAFQAESFALGAVTRQSLAGMGAAGRNRIASAAAGAFAKQGQSDSMKVLVAYTNRNASAKDQLTNALKTGDSETIRKLIAQAMRDPEAMQSRHSVSDADVARTLGSGRVTAAKAETDQYAERYLAGDATALDQYRKLSSGQAVAGKTLAQRLAKGEWDGIRPRVAKLLGSGGPTGGAAAGTSIATTATQSDDLRNRPEEIIRETEQAIATRKPPVQAVLNMVKQVTGIGGSAAAAEAKPAQDNHNAHAEATAPSPARPATTSLPTQHTPTRETKE